MGNAAQNIGLLVGDQNTCDPDQVFKTGDECPDMRQFSAFRAFLRRLFVAASNVPAPSVPAAFRKPGLKVELSDVERHGVKEFTQIDVNNLVADMTGHLGDSLNLSSLIQFVVSTRLSMGFYYKDILDLLKNEELLKVVILNVVKQAEVKRRLTRKRKFNQEDEVVLGHLLDAYILNYSPTEAAYSLSDFIKTLTEADGTYADIGLKIDGAEDGKFDFNAVNICAWLRQRVDTVINGHKAEDGVVETKGFKDHSYDIAYQEIIDYFSKPGCTKENRERFLKSLAPEVVTYSEDEDGNAKVVVDSKRLQRLNKKLFLKILRKGEPYNDLISHLKNGIKEYLSDFIGADSSVLVSFKGKDAKETELNGLGNVINEPGGVDYLIDNVMVKNYKEFHVAEDPQAKVAAHLRVIREQVVNKFGQIDKTKLAEWIRTKFGERVASQTHLTPRREIDHACYEAGWFLEKLGFKQLGLPNFPYNYEAALDVATDYSKPRKARYLHRIYLELALKYFEVEHSHEYQLMVEHNDAFNKLLQQSGLSIAEESGEDSDTAIYQPGSYEEVVVRIVNKEGERQLWSLIRAKDGAKKFNAQDIPTGYKVEKVFADVKDIAEEALNLKACKFGKGDDQVNCALINTGSSPLMGFKSLHAIVGKMVRRRLTIDKVTDFNRTTIVVKNVDDLRKIKGKLMDEFGPNVIKIEDDYDLNGAKKTDGAKAKSQYYKKFRIIVKKLIKLSDEKDAKAVEVPVEIRVLTEEMRALEVGRGDVGHQFFEAKRGREVSEVLCEGFDKTDENMWKKIEPDKADLAGINAKKDEYEFIGYGGVGADLLKMCDPANDDSEAMPADVMAKYFEDEMLQTLAA